MRHQLAHVGKSIFATVSSTPGWNLLPRSSALRRRSRPASRNRESPCRQPSRPRNGRSAARRGPRSPPAAGRSRARFDARLLQRLRQAQQLGLHLFAIRRNWTSSPAAHPRFGSDAGTHPPARPRWRREMPRRTRRASVFDVQLGRERLGRVADGHEQVVCPVPSHYK